MGVLALVLRSARSRARMAQRGARASLKERIHKMSRRWRIAVCLSLLFPLAVTVVLPLAIAQFSGESSQAANLVVLIQGHPAIKRETVTGFAPLTFGVNLQTGDLVRMDESSVAKVVCSDLKLRDIGAGTIGTPCTPSQEILRRPDGSLLRPTRTAPSEGSFPIVLSPRRTKLLSERPLPRWMEESNFVQTGIAPF